MIEDTVYCNARNMINQSTNGWNPDGGSTSTYLNFKNHDTVTDLSCLNETDQFAVGNDKAKLIYPVGLLQSEEQFSIDTFSLFKTGAEYWELSPQDSTIGTAYVRHVDDNGGSANVYIVSADVGIRFVITISSGAVITDGDGSETNPWVIE